MYSLLAVLAGWVVAVVVYQLGAVVALLAMCGIPLGSPACPGGPGYFTLNLGFAAVGAVSAGWITGLIARRRVVAHAAVLGATMAVFVLWGFNKPASQWPSWYSWALAVVGAAGAILGGTLRKGAPETTQNLPG